MLFSIIPRSAMIQATVVEVYQQEGRKAFGQETSLDIFNDIKLDGKKLIHPLSKGSYTFAVCNNSNGSQLPYSLDISSVNPDGIPLVFSLQKNGEYIYGGDGEASMAPLSEAGFLEATLGGNKTDIYTIKWEWKTESDEADTVIGSNGTQQYKLIITAAGTMSEVQGLLPKASNALIWLLLVAIVLMALLALLFYRHRKDKNEDSKTRSKNI